MPSLSSFIIVTASKKAQERPSIDSTETGDDWVFQRRGTAPLEMGCAKCDPYFRGCSLRALSVQVVATVIFASARARVTVT